MKRIEFSTLWRVLGWCFLAATGLLLLSQVGQGATLQPWPLDFKAVCTLETNYGVTLYSLPCRVYGLGETTGRTDWYISVQTPLQSLTTQSVVETTLIGRALASGGQRWVMPTWGTVEYGLLDGALLRSAQDAYYRRLQLGIAQVDVEVAYFEAQLRWIDGLPHLVFHFWKEP